MKKTTFLLFLSLISIQNLFFIKNIVSGEENTKQTISITTTEEQNNPIKETEELKTTEEIQISEKKRENTKIDKHNKHSKTEESKEENPI